MRRYFGFIFAIVLISSVSALSIELGEYEQGATVIAELKGEIIEPIFPEDVEFRRGHVLVPFDYDVKRLGERYFIWFITPRNQENYTLVVSAVSTVAGRVEQVEIMQNFSIGANISDYSIRPGAIIATEDFFVIARLNEDFSKNIELNFPEVGNVTLSPGENKIDFSIASVNETTFVEAMIGKYSVPIYIVTEGERAELNITINVTDGELRFSPKRVQSTILEGESRNYEISLINEGENIIRDVEIDYNKSIFSISPESIDSIDVNESVNLTVSLLGGLAKDVREVIYARFDNKSVDLVVDVSFTQEQGEVSTQFLDPESGTGLGYFCSEVPGSICAADEECTGQVIQVLDGSCCLDRCVVEEERGGGFLIGVGLILVLIIIVFIIWRRYKAVRPESGSSKIKEAARKGLP